MSAYEIATLINQEDMKVAQAVHEELGAIAKAIDFVSERYQKGGRIIYCGAGYSGRMGVMDAAELNPTYNVDPSRVFGITSRWKRRYV